MNILEFKYPLNILYIVIPILALILLIISYKKKESIYRVLKINTSIRFKILRNLLITFGLILIVFSLMGPQVFEGFVDLKKEGLDIYFLIDTSKSMLVTDVQPDRISRAKKIMGDIIDKLEGDRIGFIPFASDAYIQMPLTDDYPLSRMFLDVIDTNMIAGGGTNIEAAINLAYNSFERVSVSDRVIIIISDGEEHESDSQSAVKKINDEHLKIYSIGIGTQNGGLIPIYDDINGQITGYRKDASGNFVTSHLYPDILKNLAQLGNGSYYQNEVGSLLNDMSSLKRDTTKTNRIRRFKDIFQPFLALGILLFITGYLLPERRML
ncbi:UNVERIFIED_CONTAM: Ca-activated chloride channel family protein [Acetivibrio alkalicellulosi]